MGGSIVSANFENDNEWVLALLVINVRSEAFILVTISVSNNNCGGSII